MDKSTRKYEMLSEQNPNSSSWHSKAKGWSWLNYFIYTITIQCTVCSNHTSHLPASQYPYQALTSFFFLAYHGNTVLITLPTHLCHQSKPHSFSSQMIRATWGLSKIAGKFEHFYFLSEFCLYVLATFWQII